MQHEPTNSTNEAEEINEVTEVWSDGVHIRSSLTLPGCICRRLLHKLGSKQSPWRSSHFHRMCLNLWFDVLYHIRTWNCVCKRVTRFVLCYNVPGPPKHWPHLQAAYWPGNRWAIICRGLSEREEEGGCGAVCSQCMQDARCTGHAQEPHTRWPLNQGDGCSVCSNLTQHVKACTV